MSSGQPSANLQNNNILKCEAKSAMPTGLTASKLPVEDLLKCSVCPRDLHEPLFLKCLHSICRSCADDATTSVTCPMCRVTTDITAKRTNHLVSVLAYRSRIMKTLFSCTHCAESNVQSKSTDWCCECQQSLCRDCKTRHDKYKSTHKNIAVHQVAEQPALYLSPYRLCESHSEKMKLACFTCQDGRCIICAHSCYRASHDIHPLGHPATEERMKVLLSDASRVFLSLSSTSTQLQAHLSLPEKMATTREQTLAMLRKAKMTAIESISGACQNAEEALLAIKNNLDSQALFLCESAANFKTRLAWTNRYCQMALNSNDIFGLVSQFDTICSALGALLQEARRIKEPDDFLKPLSVNVSVPRDLDLITSSWFGKTTFTNDNDGNSLHNLPAEGSGDYYSTKVSTLHEIEQLVEQNRVRQQTLQGERNLVQLEEQNPTHVTSEIGPSSSLCFGDEPRGSFKCPAQCCDVAVTSQGRILVAAMADGLKEYHATSFQEMTTWKPKCVTFEENVDMSVCSVDALDDGSALVGLCTNTIVLLQQRNASTNERWQSERRVATLQGPPRRLSAWTDQLFVALEDHQCNENTSMWLCNTDLVLFSLSRAFDNELHRQKLDYYAGSVCMTDRVIIVASSEENIRRDGVSGSRNVPFVVECYSHFGVSLWRRVVGNGLHITSVCSDFVGRVVYAASRRLVVALSVDDGYELCTAITLSKKETEHPCAIRLDKTNRRLLALLSQDNDKEYHISVFPVM